MPNKNRDLRLYGNPLIPFTKGGAGDFHEKENYTHPGKRFPYPHRSAPELPIAFSHTFRYDHLKIWDH